MSCDNNKNRKAQNEDDVNKAKASLDEANAALAEVTKQEADEEKKHADTDAGIIMFVISSAALGLVSKCRIPTVAVAQRGLFRILLGSTEVTNIVQKHAYDPEMFNCTDCGQQQVVYSKGDYNGGYDVLGGTITGAHGVLNGVDVFGNAAKLLAVKHGFTVAMVNNSAILDT